MTNIQTVPICWHVNTGKLSSNQSRGRRVNVRGYLFVLSSLLVLIIMPLGSIAVYRRNVSLVDHLVECHMWVDVCALER